MTHLWLQWTHWRWGPCRRCTRTCTLLRLPLLVCWAYYGKKLIKRIINLKLILIKWYHPLILASAFLNKTDQERTVRPRCKQVQLYFATELCSERCRRIKVMPPWNCCWHDAVCPRHDCHKNIACMQSDRIFSFQGHRAWLWKLSRHRQLLFPPSLGWLLDDNVFSESILMEIIFIEVGR